MNTTKCYSLFSNQILFVRESGLTLASGFLFFFQGLDGEVSVALCALQAHFYRSVVLHCCADVPVAEGDRNKGADVHSSDMLVEEKSHHVAF